MNERIDKLLVKAGAYFGGEGVDYSNFDPKKFAELIVKECASVCHTHGWGMLEHGMSGHSIADDCGTLIKEHFGVEE